MGILKIHVQLFENFENLIAFQVSCLAFTKNFGWFPKGNVLDQDSLNSFGVIYAKTHKIHSLNHISCKEYFNTL